MRDHGGNIDAAIARFGGADWIDLSTGINRVPYPVRTLPQSAWTALPTKSAMASLCAAARARYSLAPEAALAPLAGAQGAIQLLPYLVKRGRARVFGPTYNEHAAALIAAGWQVETVSNIAEIAGADLGVVVNPNNPGGQTFAPETLLDLRREVGALLVDESFSDATPALSIAPHLGETGLFVLRSFGKFYGLAGVRLGFVLGAAPEISAIADMAGPWPVSGAAIELGTRALQDSSWIAATIDRLAQDCARMDEIAAKTGWTLVGGSALFRLYSCQNAAIAQEALARNQIWSRIFPWSETFIRLGLPGSETEWERVANALG